MQRTVGRQSAPHSSHAASLSDNSVAQSGTAVNRHSMQDSGKQYAVGDTWYDFSKPFVQQVQDWINGRIPERDSLLVGRTPEVYRKTGLSDFPMTFDQKHMGYAVNGTKESHQMSLKMLGNAYTFAGTSF